MVMKGHPAKKVDKYISKCPKGVQPALKKVRATIQQAAPGATERTDYFQLPGYSYEGYDYDGMFAWFSYKEPHVRLHVRPQAIREHSKELRGYKTTAGIVCFPEDEKVSIVLVKKLVKASIKAMKDKSRLDRK